MWMGFVPSTTISLSGNSSSRAGLISAIHRDDFAVGSFKKSRLLSNAGVGWMSAFAGMTDKAGTCFESSGESRNPVLVNDHAPECADSCNRS